MHYSRLRMEAKRRATGAIVDGAVHQNVHQPSERDSSASPKSLNQMVGLGGLEPPTSPLSVLRSSVSYLVVADL
jgi:hypothetical protein